MPNSKLLAVVVVGLGLVTTVIVKGQPKNPALTALDYAEIQQLAARYGHAIDTCANNGYDYADLYTPGGTFTDKYT